MAEKKWVSSQNVASALRALPFVGLLSVLLLFSLAYTKEAYHIWVKLKTKCLPETAFVLLISCGDPQAVHICETLYIFLHCHVHVKVPFGLPPQAQRWSDQCHALPPGPFWRMSIALYQKCSPQKRCMETPNPTRVRTRPCPWYPVSAALSLHFLLRSLKNIQCVCVTHPCQPHFPLQFGVPTIPTGGAQNAKLTFS